MNPIRSFVFVTALVLGVVASSVVFVAAPAHAATAVADAVFRGFERNYDYSLVVDGKVQPSAEVYQITKRVPAFLIISSALSAPVMLSPGSGSVETLQLMKVLKRPDGTVDVSADAVLAPQGSFEMKGTDVVFKVEGHRIALKQRPDLLGLQTSAAVVAYNPLYGQGAKAYQPSNAVVSQLKKKTQPIKVRVFFGSWCPHCREHVPFAIKVEELLKGSKIQFEYFGLSRGLTDAEAKKNDVRGVPTAVVYVNGKEIGRIKDTGWDAPESALAELLTSKKIS